MGHLSEPSRILGKAMRAGGSGVVAFVISNDRHHVGMTLPVIDALRAESGLHCEVLSLCEFRGMHTPYERLRKAGISATALLRKQLPRSPGAARTSRDARLHAVIREVGRGLSWCVLLRRPFSRWLARPPALVVTPNDAAFPYNFMLRRLRRRHVPFLLLQEGLRDDQPGSIDPGTVRQGRGGATAVACWGETSREYFVKRGVPKERTFVTGSPRFDEIAATDWEPRLDLLRKQLKIEGGFVVFLSNPIEYWGVCARSRRVELLGKFVNAVLPLLDTRQLSLVIKLHSSDPVGEIRAAVGASQVQRSVIVTQDAPLYPLLAGASAAVTFGSSAGLEALLFSVPLAVLEVPGRGYLMDFVERGAATPLSWAAPMSDQLETLLAGGGAAQDLPAVERYLSATLGARRDSSAWVARVIAALLRGDPDVLDRLAAELATGALSAELETM